MHVLYLHAYSHAERGSAIIKHINTVDSKSKKVEFVDSEPWGKLYRPQWPTIIGQPDDATFQWQHISWLALQKQRLFNFLLWLQNCLALEVSYGILFLFIPVFIAIGAIFYFTFAKEVDFPHIFAWILLNSGILYLFRRYYILWYIIAFLLCVLIGFAAAKFETWRLDTTMLGSDVSTHLTGRILAVETLEDGRKQLTLDVLTTHNPLLYYPPERVRLSAKGLPEGLKPGDGISGLVRLFAASGPPKPGGYDFSYYNYYQYIGAQGFFMGKPIQIDIAPPNTMINRLILKTAYLRHIMTNRIQQSLSGETANVAAALITGQRKGISDATNEALRLSGLAHILSISGLHMAMVSGMTLVVIRSFFSFFPVFSSYYSSKKIAAIFALFVAGFYLLLSGADVAAQRSFIMVAVMLVSILFDRSSITLRNLSIAALITLLIVPHEVLSPSFQMSFSATAALVAAFDYWAKRKNQQKNTAAFVGAGILRKAFFPIGSTAMASLIAGLASGVFAAYHFSNAAPFGVISNALAFPIMSFLVMPFALIGSIFMLIGLEWLPLQIMGFGIEVVEKIAYSIADISPQITISFISAPGLIFTSFGLVTLIYFKTKLRLFSLVFFVFAGLICFYQAKPLVLISEDANLVALIKDQQLYIQKKRANKFTLSIWQASYNLKNVIPPAVLGQQTGAQFGCDDSFCYALLANGQKITVVLEKSFKKRECPISDIIVVNYAANIKNCPNDTQIITKQDLALKGSAALMDNGKWIFAINGPTRPWNMHRKYSRAARGF